MSPEQEITRAIHADRLLSDPLLREAFDRLRVEILEQWEACRDEARRDRLWMELNALGKVKSHLTQIVNSGKISAKQLGRPRGWLT